MSWQAEEVAWGDFVPYPVIAVAADLSIQRLARDGKWPGKVPPIQSEWLGCLPDNEKYEETDEWANWDFVPDGLLVWEAWLNHFETISPENPTTSSSSVT